MSCLACDADPPGGSIAETEHWVVQHTVGSLGVGTLIVKPRRHVLHLGELTPEEAEELGPLLQRAGVRGRVPQGFLVTQGGARESRAARRSETSPGEGRAGVHRR